jgi:hypothetical protein
MLVETTGSPDLFDLCDLLWSVVHLPEGIRVATGPVPVGIKDQGVSRALMTELEFIACR